MGSCPACPIYSAAPEGSTSLDACRCTPGTHYDEAVGQCKPCGIGSYCPGNNTQYGCQAALPATAATCHIPLTTLTEFSTQLNQCACWTQGRFSLLPSATTTDHTGARARRFLHRIDRCLLTGEPIIKRGGERERERD